MRRARVALVESISIAAGRASKIEGEVSPLFTPPGRREAGFMARAGQQKNSAIKLGKMIFEGGVTRWEARL